MNYTMRAMRPGEEAWLWQLFHDAIHGATSNEYTPRQQRAWAPHLPDLAAWKTRLAAVQPFIACIASIASEDSEALCGFSDLQQDGLIDFFFVNVRWRGRGVASAMMAEIERRAAAAGIDALYAHVSLTAQPYFSHVGFEIDHRKTVTTRGVEMDNFLMRRRL